MQWQVAVRGVMISATPMSRLSFLPHTKVMLLSANVQAPRKPLMMKPAKMHLISLIPLPAAYGAKVRTR